MLVLGPIGGFLTTVSLSLGSETGAMVVVVVAIAVVVIGMVGHDMYLLVSIERDTVQYHI